MQRKTGEKIPRLSRRLLCAASLVRRGTRAADVGCDHGKLAAWLICSGQASSVVATDINPLPLQKAQELFRDLGIEDRTRTVLCAGLDGVLPNEAQDIVIAGIGSEVTTGIIQNAPWLKEEDRRLILVPASHHERVRAFLYRQGYELLYEQAVFEAGHCYSVMHARFCGCTQEISPAFAALGLIRPQQGADAAAYCARELEKARRIRQNTNDPQKAFRAQQVERFILAELGQSTDGL